jgi:hypothetical protein
MSLIKNGKNGKEMKPNRGEAIPLPYADLFGHMAQLHITPEKSKTS